MTDVISPTQKEFKDTARAEFRFLKSDYEFKEVPPEYDDPYQIQYQNGYCRVHVVGRSFGFALDIGIERIDYDAKKDPYTGVFPLWCILELRDPELYNQRFQHTSGQLKMLRIDAKALGEYCQDLLVGDFSIEPQVSVLLRKRWEESREVSRKEQARWEHERATTAANKAFQNKDYLEVIQQLESVEDRLTPSQLKKLAYARKHKPRSLIQKIFSKKQE